MIYGTGDCHGDCIFRRLSACCTAIVSNRSGLLSKSGNGKGPFRSAVIKGLSRHKRGRCPIYSTVPLTTLLSCVPGRCRQRGTEFSPGTCVVALS